MGLIGFVLYDVPVTPNEVWPVAQCFCPYVCRCVHPETLQYLGKYLPDFHQTYTNDALGDRNECVKL